MSYPFHAPAQFANRDASNTTLHCRNFWLVCGLLIVNDGSWVNNGSDMFIRVDKFKTLYNQILEKETRKQSSQLGMRFPLRVTTQGGEVVT